MHTYFLGANTPTGFVSRYDSLFSDSRIRRTLIIKGGPGCGKSTLMRKVSAAAQQLACSVEELPCSSDPDSLDGLVIPDAGLALVDGTAPHILEPPLCGCGAEYLDLGASYDSAALLVRKKEITALKAKNAACYPLATACFSAAAAVSGALQALAKPDGIDAITVSLCAPKKADCPAGARSHRFYEALTPKGTVSCRLPCRSVWALQDSFGVAPRILSAVADSFTDAGYDVLLGYDPLRADALSHVLVPQLSSAYITVNDLFPYLYKTSGQYDLDALCMQNFSTAEALHAQQLIRLKEQSVHEGLKFLKEAKACHDALEAAYKPAVDFSVVDRQAEKVKKLLIQQLSAM